MCFLGCERADIEGWDGGVVDENEYCQRQVHSDFICRSSGGGSQNRKVCVPGDCGVGESCGRDTDCADGLTLRARVSGWLLHAPGLRGERRLP